MSDPAFGTFAASASAPLHFLGTHATLLGNDKVLLVGGGNFNCCYQVVNGSAPKKEEAHLYDIASNSWSAPLASPAPYGPDFDAFCSGHVHDAEGSVIFQGGLLGNGIANAIGVPKSAKYSMFTGTALPLGAGGSETQPNNYMDANYYPTLVAGPLHTYIFPGDDAGHITDVNSEFYDQRPIDNNIARLKQGASAWTTTNIIHRTQGTYPRVHLIPDGRFFVASPSYVGNAAWSNNRNHFYDPPDGTVWQIPSASVPDPNGEGALSPNANYKGSSVLLPLAASANGVYTNPKVAMFNAKKAYKIDLGVAAPAWTETAARPNIGGQPPKSRRNATSVLLPTGQVMISGGVDDLFGSDTSAVKEVEVYDPALDQWLVTSAAQQVRSYHAIALLLRDGRVWTTSGNRNEKGSDCYAGPPAGAPPDACDGAGNWLAGPLASTGDTIIPQSEMFQPWYVGHASRPTITSAPDNVSSDGSIFNIGIGGSQGANIKKVALMRAGSVTHGFDADQRLIWLDIIPKDASTISVRAPYGAAAAPPGDYMLFVLRDLGTGAPALKRYVPSVGRWIRVANQHVVADVASIDFDTTVNFAGLFGYRVASIDAYESGPGARLNIVLTRNDNVEWFSRVNMTPAQFQAELTARPAPWRLIHIESYWLDNVQVYAAAWNKTPAPGGATTHWYNKTLAEHTALLNQFPASQGYRVVNESTVMVSGVARYSALLDKAPVGVFTVHRGFAPADLAGKVWTEALAGRRLAYVSAYVDGSVHKLNAVFNAYDTGRFDTVAADTSFSTMHERRIQHGLRLQTIATYANGGLRFAAAYGSRPLP